MHASVDHTLRTEDNDVGLFVNHLLQRVKSLDYSIGGKATHLLMQDGATIIQ